MKIFYFTGTGNSLSVAKEIGGELYSIPKIMKGNNITFEDEKIGIIFPCHGTGIPKIVEDFLKKVTLKSPYIFAIVSFGYKNAGVINQFNKIAKKNGVKISYINDILMIDNAVGYFDIEDELQKLPSKKIEENLEKIIEHIDNNTIYKKNNTFIEKATTNLFQLLYRNLALGKASKKFQVESHCNSCMTCEKVCPVDNIKVNGKPEFSDKCIVCSACTHNCPQNAIRVEGEKSKARFRNPNVSLSEIVDANN